MSHIVNQRELSEVTGVSQVTLWNWKKEGMPVVRSGENGQEDQYDTVQVIDWMLAREAAKYKQEGEKDRLARLQGDKIELELAELRAELVPASKIEPAWTSIAMAVRQALLPLGVRLAPLLETTSGIDAKRALIDEEVREALLKLSRHGDDSAAGPDPQGDGKVRTAEEGAANRVG